MRIPVDKVTDGLVPDQPDYALPDGVWTDGRNVRFRDGGAEKVGGTVPVLGSLSATAVWAESLRDVSANVDYWVYSSLTRLYGTDGTTHADISSITYSASADLGWNGGAFHGYVIANESTEPPQTWQPGLTNKFQPLANWPASTLCKVIRPYGDFLVAMRVTESSVYNPRLIRWSDAAGVGSLPGSWDYTDPTNQSGRAELGQTDDAVVDCLPMRDVNVVYKKNTTWLMQYIGLPDVFQFRQAFSQAGMLTENCAGSFNGNHFVVTDSDIIVHDGSQITPLADKRTRKWLFATLNADYYLRSYVIVDQKNREVWFCFPESGHTYPNIALCWNWSHDVFYVRELGGDMTYAATGPIPIVSDSPLWSAASDTWDTTDLGAWGPVQASPWSGRILSLDSARMLAYQQDTNETFNGSTMTSYLMRSNMGLTRDVGSMKRVRRIFPKVLGTTGDTMQIRVGARDTIDGPLRLQGPFTFTIGVDYKIDCRIAGRFIYLWIQHASIYRWRLIGFDVEFDGDGLR